MSVFAKKFLVILTIAALGLTGCTKKPVRPDPSATMLGQGGAGGGGYNDTLLNQGIDTTDPLFDGSATGLEMRGGDGYYEDDQMIKGLLEPVYFDFDQSGIKTSERIKLQAAIDYLNLNPQHRLLLEGHCDWKGTSEYNLGLGDRRSGSARQFLETAGVAASRLETSSKGDLDAVENADDGQMAKDRRVELIILK